MPRRIALFGQAAFARDVLVRLLDAGHEIVAVNSFVLNENCAGSSFGYRVDKAAVQEWINSFLD